MNLGADLGTVTDIDLGLAQEETDNSGPGSDSSNSGSGNSGSGSDNSGSGSDNSGSGSDNSGPSNVVDGLLDTLTRRSAGNDPYQPPSRLVADRARRIRRRRGAAWHGTTAAARECRGGRARPGPAARGAVRHRHRRHRRGQPRAARRWPWPRRHHAKLLQISDAGKPRRVFIDIDFSSQSNALDDALLEAALAKPRDFPVLLPIFFQYARGADATALVSQPLPRSRAAPTSRRSTARRADGLTRAWRNSWTLDGERLPSVIDPRSRVAGRTDVPIDFSISPASFTYVSYVDVLEGRVPREVFAGKTFSSARPRWSSATWWPCRCIARCPASWCRRWPPKP